MDARRILLSDSDLRPGGVLLACPWAPHDFGGAIEIARNPRRSTAIEARYIRQATSNVGGERHRPERAGTTDRAHVAGLRLTEALAAPVGCSGM